MDEPVATPVELFSGSKFPKGSTSTRRLPTLLDQRGVLQSHQKYPWLVTELRSEGSEAAVRGLCGLCHAAQTTLEWSEDGVGEEEATEAEGCYNALHRARTNRASSKKTAGRGQAVDLGLLAATKRITEGTVTALAGAAVRSRQGIFQALKNHDEQHADLVAAARALPGVEFGDAAVARVMTKVGSCCLATSQGATAGATASAAGFKRSRDKPCITMEHGVAFNQLALVVATIQYKGIPDSALNDLIMMAQATGSTMPASATQYQLREITDAMVSVSDAELKEELRSSPGVALLGDGSTDRSNRALEVIMLRYLRNGVQPCEVLVRVAPVDGGTARKHGIVDAHADAAAILNTYMLALRPFFDAEDGFLEKLDAIGLDGASTNVGKLNGIAAMLVRAKAQRFPHLSAPIVLHCSAHRLQLALGDVSRALTRGRTDDTRQASSLEADVRDIVSRVSRFYNYSPQRTAELQVMDAHMEALCDGVLKFVNYQETRWAEYERRSLRVFLNNWAPVVFHIMELLYREVGMAFTPLSQPRDVVGVHVMVEQDSGNEVPAVVREVTSVEFVAVGGGMARPEPVPHFIVEFQQETFPDEELSVAELLLELPNVQHQAQLQEGRSARRSTNAGADSKTKKVRVRELVHLFDDMRQATTVLGAALKLDVRRMVTHASKSLQNGTCSTSSASMALRRLVSQLMTLKAVDLDIRGSQLRHLRSKSDVFLLRRNVRSANRRVHNRCVGAAGAPEQLAEIGSGAAATAAAAATATAAAAAAPRLKITTRASVAGRRRACADAGAGGGEGGKVGKEDEDEDPHEEDADADEGEDEGEECEPMDDGSLSETVRKVLANVDGELPDPPLDAVLFDDDEDKDEAEAEEEAEGSLRADDLTTILKATGLVLAEMQFDIEDSGSALLFRTMPLLLPEADDPAAALTDGLTKWRDAVVDTLIAKLEERFPALLGQPGATLDPGQQVVRTVSAFSVDPVDSLSALNVQLDKTLTVHSNVAKELRIQRQFEPWINTSSPAAFLQSSVGNYVPEELEAYNPERWTWQQRAMQVAAVIPMSTASCERTFSVLNDVHTKKRNALLVSSISAELVLRTRGFAQRLLFEGCNKVSKHQRKLRLMDKVFHEYKIARARRGNLSVPVKRPRAKMPLSQGR